MAGIENAPQIRLKHLDTLQELNEAVGLQQEIWGFEDIELLPLRLFVVATKVGGQAIGAFDGDKMIGFLLAIPGLKRGTTTYLHSHMMGVTAPYRNAGVGRLLKLEQRREALSRGIELIEWTFDPLEIKNAYFNIERLGAVVRRYVLNQYGTTTSHLHGGLPTDRCVAEWYLDSPRVLSIVDHRDKIPAGIEDRIPVPTSIDTIRKNEPKRARDVQQAISDKFLDCFHRGLAVTGFDKTDDFGTYLLSPWPSK